MKNFKKILREINFTLDQIFIFDSILDTIILFLIIYLMLSLFNFYPIAAFIPALVYFIMSVFADFKKNKARIVESKYFSLREKLRTAADNIRMDNPVVEELHEEIEHDVRNVRASSFINSRKLYYKIALSVGLSFLIVLFATINVTIIDMNALITGGDSIINKISSMGSDAIYTDINESEDLYGKKSVAKLGDKELNIQIMPANYRVSVREEGDFDQKEFDEIFPKDAFVESSSAYEENIPKEQQELVKSYFNNLAKG